ncbi:MAG: hypothetical protein WKF87_03935 [Chryseolinea sp.]
MNNNQEQVLSRLSKLSDGQYYKIEPATADKVTIFRKRATEKGVDKYVIDELIDLYQVADNFYYEIVMGFHSCTDEMTFEWWNEKELWLGQRDFNTLRWANGKFCLGDASSISFSTDYESDNLVGLLECCMREIENANNYDKLNSGE